MLASQTQCSTAKGDVLYLSVSSEAVKISLPASKTSPGGGSGSLIEATHTSTHKTGAPDSVDPPHRTEIPWALILSQKTITAICLFCQSRGVGEQTAWGNGGGREGREGREMAMLRHPQAQQPVLRLGRLCLQASWLLLSDFSRSTNAGFLAQICDAIVLSLRLARIPPRQH